VPDNDEGLIVTMEIDQWEIQGDLLIRHHKRPRLNRFFPTDCSDMPVGPQNISQQDLPKDDIVTVQVFANMTYGRIIPQHTAHNPTCGQERQSFN
jgi:hypothetical protein